MGHGIWYIDMVILDIDMGYLVTLCKTLGGVLPAVAVPQGPGRGQCGHRAGEPEPRAGPCRALCAPVIIWISLIFMDLVSGKSLRVLVGRHSGSLSNNTLCRTFPSQHNCQPAIDVSFEPPASCDRSLCSRFGKTTSSCCVH